MTSRCSITVDAALSYIASRMRYAARKDEPVPGRRGAAVVLDRRHALVWVNGTADGLAGKHYYQGKSRIGVPLMITRHHGKAPFATSPTRSSA